MKRTITIVFIIVAVLVMVGLSLFRKELNNIKAPDTVFPPNQDIIRIAVPKLKTFSKALRWFGKVKSGYKTRIIALEAGRIISVAVKDGAAVTKGDILFTIGGPLIDSRMELLYSQSATLKKRIKLAERMVRVKREAVVKQFAKYEELASAEDALARLKAEREAVRRETQRIQKATRLHAAISGVFTNRKVSVGQEVQKGDDLAEVISQDRLYIAATLFLKGEEASLKTKTALINLPSGKQIQGSITTVLPQRTHDGAVIVWIKGPEIAAALHPGQTVTGKIILSMHKKALALPQKAIVRDDQERAYVFEEDSSGYRKQPVKTGIVADGWVEIVSGLKAGDKVVVQGAYELFYRDFNKIYKVAD